MSPWLLQRVHPGIAAVATFGQDRREYGVLLDIEIPLGSHPPFFYGDRECEP